MKYLILVGAGIVFLVAYSIVYQLATARLLRKHQCEWNDIKSRSTEIEVDDAYMEYIEYLMNNRHPWLGCCSLGGEVNEHSDRR